MFNSPLSSGVVGKALKNQIIDVNCIDIRLFTDDQHKSVDDYPFGGGGGMILKPEPIFKAVDHLKQKSALKETDPIILLSPQGRKLNQDQVEILATNERLVLICGRYDGVDERVVKHLVTDEISIGDYVISGGELAAMVLVDCLTRLQENALGSAESIKDDSHTSGLLQFPQFTRPSVFREWKVPDILLSGNHEEIKKYREVESIKRTLQRRPDLFHGVDIN
ncbi:MAG: tRNA (guanosine(37)-N1)-methyltransferase TrmD [Dehalococcoidia bacterium]|nr:tRNA (guanosine(37)-N1)-methyltransferase TrmD [Dehalococcoidia bacterium]MQG16286.1 tRNA (guanosine(37)-N1)-methyltransferase TrmD [SAR202 cluster bacterium]|tara:strand:+ start:12133 stop:12798 length:666 start_codon:yes stop_codon:yes gene_type:complete